MIAIQIAAIYLAIGLIAGWSFYLGFRSASKRDAAQAAKWIVIGWLPLLAFTAWWWLTFDPSDGQ